MAPTVNRNEDKNGIELSFTEKPSESVRNFLKKVIKARWHWKKKIWYCKYSQERMKLIEQALCSG